MSFSSKNRFSASEQGLGYIYQPRFALLKMFDMPERISVFIEKDDDLDFLDENGVKSLASLKHKAPGDRLTDLSTDFWKSVRIWVDRYIAGGKIQCDLRFFLFTTGDVANNSFLTEFLSPKSRLNEKELLDRFESEMDRSSAKVIKEVAQYLTPLTPEEKKDFISRIEIVPNGTRIEDIRDQIIESHMKSVRREFRSAVFERLEGWWNNKIIELLTGKNKAGIIGFEISDKLAEIAQEYRDDNLPIHFGTSDPNDDHDIESDNRLFVRQLKGIGVSNDRIKRAIFDYYRAFQQRSIWARENVLVSGEVENYEDKLVDEWGRYKEILEDELDPDATEDALKKTGRNIYNWAQTNTGNLRIRERVSEPYVVRGCFHILANAEPRPRVHWHPRFFERLDKVLES